MPPRSPSSTNGWLDTGRSGATVSTHSRRNFGARADNGRRRADGPELGALSLDGDRCAVHFERLYDATTEEVWRALTEPAQLAGWLADAPRLELRAGGEIHLDIGEDDQMRGMIREIEPPRVLEYTWPEAFESVVRFELHPPEGGVMLVLDHRALPAEKAPSYGAGWHSHLDMLDAHLAGGSLDFMPRYEELRTAYEEQVAALR